MNPNEELRIYNSMGQLVKKMRLTANGMAINVSNLSAGVYYVMYGNDKKYLSTIWKQ